MESKSTTSNPTTQQLARQVTAALQQPRRLTVQKPTNAIADLMAGGLAGMAGIFVGHPLDSLKVRMQMGGGSIRTLLSQSSTFGSVWNGLPAPLAGAATLNACLFFTYGSTTRLWDKYDTTNDGNNDTNQNSLAKEAICGGFTGFVSSFIMCPTEHIKTKLQLNATMYRNSFHAAQEIFTTHGFAGLNRGFVATAIRQAPGFCVYFGTYERLKDSLQTQHNIQCNPLVASILAGGFAGSLSWAIVYPIDLVKSRIQALPLDCSKSDRSIMRIGNTILKESGWRALYRGFGITVLRAFPVNAVILTTHCELRTLFERAHVR
jgi:solute carrier family 25 carnitine/acylcarnitine transporter 20/29